MNGKSLPFPEVRKGFVRLQRTFHSDDRVTLTLPMQVATTSWPSNGIGVEHGPLVYALAVKEDWKSVVTPQYSTATFPEWNATPASPWNYALLSDPTQFDSRVKLERKPMTEDPWENPPVSFTVPLKKVPGWALQVPPEHPDRRQTPPLPEMTTELTSSIARSPVESVALVPYGSMQLRLTIFPSA